MASQNIRIVLEGLDRSQSKVIRDYAINSGAELQRVTPVDIGWARANYVYGIGEPNRIDGKPGKNEDETRNRLAEIKRHTQNGLHRLHNYHISQGFVYISNNVPYITRLNNGSSTQAPKGFIQAALKRVAVRFERRFGSGN